MVYSITKTKAALRHEYSVSKESNVIYQGKIGSLSKYQALYLENDSQKIKASYRFSNILQYIPFKYLFGKPKVNKKFKCFINDGYIGSFAKSIEGVLKFRYIINLGNDNVFYVYNISNGKYSYLCIYLDDDETQIAQVDTFLTSNNGCFEHYLYLLDEYEHLEQILLMLVLYYDNFEFTTRGKYYVGKSYETKHSFNINSIQSIHS